MSGSGETPHGPENPDINWFRSGTIDANKLDKYVLSPLHPIGQHKARRWREVFGLEQGDGQLLADLIRQQLVQVQSAIERDAIAFAEDPSKQARRFTLDIPRFRGPNGNIAMVRTNWALDPDKETPHLSTTFPRVGRR
jgi:hypothetical protein